jgi:hypothetical protein
MPKKPKKIYSITMKFDDWVNIHSELQAKAMFVGGLNKLNKSERLLLVETGEIMFGDKYDNKKAAN